MMGKSDSAVAGTVRYVLNKEGAERLPVGILSRAWKDVERNFATMESARPQLGDKRRHIVLSLPPGEHLSSEQWCDFVERYMSKMGYEDAPWIAVLRHDQAQEHVHIVASRVRYDGGVVNIWMDRVRSRDVIRELEREFGLRQTARAYEASRRGLNQREAQRGARSRSTNGLVEPPAKSILHEHLLHATKGRPTMAEWVRRLEALGVTVRVRLEPSGRVAGLSFGWGGAAFKASELGQDYSWKATCARIDYDEERDAGVLRQLAVHTEPATARQAPSDGARWSDTLDALNRSEDVLLRDIVRSATEGPPTGTEWVRRLQEAGVGVRVNVQSTGQVAGVSFVRHGFVSRGSDVGKDCSWPALAAAIEFDPERDVPAFQKASAAVRAALLEASRAGEAPAAAPTSEARDRGPAAAPRDPGSGTTPSPLEELRELVHRATAGRPTGAEWAQRLEAMGIGLRAHVQSTGRVTSVSFVWRGYVLRGSDVGKDCSWRILRARIDFRPDVDVVAFRDAAERCGDPGPGPAPPPPTPIPATMLPEPVWPPGKVGQLRAAAWRRCARDLAEVSKRGAR